MELCSVQVKGGQARFQYGGIAKQKWRVQDFIWLQSRGLPHYLARVDAKREAVELFSLWQIWWVLLQCSG